MSAADLTWQVKLTGRKYQNGAQYRREDVGTLSTTGKPWHDVNLLVAASALAEEVLAEPLGMEMPLHDELVIIIRRTRPGEKAPVPEAVR